MKSFTRRVTATVLTIVLSGIITPLGISAQDDKPKKKSKLLIELDKTATALKLPPLSGVDSSVTKGEVDLIIYKEIAEAGIPAFEEERLKAEVEKKYNLWKIGDEIKTIDAQGFLREGKLTEKNGKYIKIGDTRIFTIDFSEQMLPHLSEKHKQAAVDKFMDDKKRVYRLKRRDFKEKLRKSTKLKYYKKYGFVNYGDKWLDYKTYKAFLTKGNLLRKKKLELLKAKKEAEEAKQEPKETEKTVIEDIPDDKN